MNEAGLAVELMWLDETHYPEPDARPALGCLEWIQYQLDRRTRENRRVRSAALSAFDFSCATPVKLLGIDEGMDDVAGRFADYTPEANRKLVASAIRQTDFLAGIPPKAVAEVVDHPESTSCVAGGKSP